jgi:predicted RNase H-like HicB family nuclease
VRLLTYTVIFEKGPESWGAYVPDLPGVIAVGDSREEVEDLIREAAEAHLEGLREEGLEIPLPASFAGSVDVPSAA